jgi:Zn-finger nucleic acid-binding protein
VSKRIAILAAMAHADVKNIQEDVIAGEKLRDASRQMVGNERPRPIIINIETMLPGSGSPVNCPKCAQPLIDEEYEGVAVRRCTFCEGILIEKGRIPRIIIREEKGFADRIKKMAALTQGDGLRRMRDKVKTAAISYLKCPKCGQDMLRNFYTAAYLVEVDRCDTCNLIWFDKDELEVLQYLIENKKSE